MRITTLKQCYQRLELPYKADVTEIRQAYKRLVKKWHPDKFEADPSIKAYAEERIKIINAAYDVLCQQQSPINTPSTSKNDPTRRSIKPRYFDIFSQNNAFFKWQPFHRLTAVFGFLKDMFHPSGSNQVHTRQTGMAGDQKLHQTFQQNQGHIKANSLKKGNDRKKKPNGFKTIYDLRKHYGPRHKKGAGSISEVSPRDKTQTINSVRRIVPIRPIE